MIYHGDLFDVLPTFHAESIDACVTDPPYGIGFMNKKWDTFKPGEGEKRVKPRAEIVSENPNLKNRKRVPASSPSAVAYDRSLEGQRQFQTWTEEWAREVWRVLKPGAYLLVCGAPRSYHRMTSGLEDAGFEIRDCFCWLFGSGFPKSLDVSKAIDKAAGAEREVLGLNAHAHKRTGADKSGTFDNRGPGLGGIESAIVTAPSTDLAKQWQGWGTALKPAYEPIVLARKPFKGSLTANLQKHGTGAINIDACRIGTADGHGGGARMSSSGHTLGEFGQYEQDGFKESSLGRWPANVLLDEEAAKMLDQQSGELSHPGNKADHEYVVGQGSNVVFSGKTVADGSAFNFGDSGGASRFFYVAKPSRAEREEGIYDLEPRQRDDSRKDGNPGGDNPRNRGLQRRGNHHPTVKPVELMRWLVKLVTPPGGTVLDPFCGSGTTGMACAYEFRPFIGIERESEYVEIAKRRIAASVPLFHESGDRSS